MVMLSTTMIMTRLQCVIVPTDFVIIECIGIITINTDIMIMMLIQTAVGYSDTYIYVCTAYICS